ncbi:O-antigen ligase family protein [bacterium]|jgi:O-antigen ligase|nr:O-antigen ligase family protein [bacterium]
MKYSSEEHPIIEFPALLKIFLVFIMFCFGISLLFLPCYIVLALFFVFCITIGIVFNPFIGVILFLTTIYLHVMAFAPVELVLIHPAIIAGGIVFFSWLFHIIIFKDFSFPNSSQFYCVVGFSFIAFLSIIYHYNDYSNFFLVFNLIKMLILYFLIVNMIKTKRQFYISLSLILVLTFSTAFYGILQYLQSGGSGDMSRVVGFEGNPNALSMNSVLIVPCLLGFIYYQFSLKLKLLFLVIFLVILLGIIFTFSRAGFVTLAAVFSMSLFVFSKGRARFIMATILFLLFMVLLPFLPEQYWERIQSITDLKEASIVARLDSYRVGLQMIKDNLLIGIGPGRWHAEYVPHAVKLLGITAYTKYPHNVFIEVAAEIGVIALILYGFLLFFSFKELNEARKIFKEKKEFLLSIISQSFLISLIGFLVNTTFEAGIGLKIFWLIAGLAVVLKKIAINIEPKPQIKNS